MNSELDSLLSDHRRFVESSGDEGRLLDLTGWSIENHVFRDGDFSSLTFHGTRFVSCRFIGCIFSHAVFSGVHMEDCDLRECGLIKAEAFDSRFYSCRFDGADLSRSFFSKCVFDGSVFDGARLLFSVFQGAAPQADTLSPAETEGLSVEPAPRVEKSER